MSRDVLNDLLSLDPERFEEFIADVWQERQGWITAVTKSSDDHGVDVIGQPPGRPYQKTAVQCKRYSPPLTVGRPEIQQYNSLKYSHDDIVGVTIVTTSSFSSRAIDEAERLDVKCIDGSDLVEIIERQDAYEILDRYLSGWRRTEVVDAG